MERSLTLRRLDRAALLRRLGLTFALVGWMFASEARATIKWGDIQLSGNIETQNLVRLHDTFNLYPVQQRNTLRLQYEHDLIRGGKLTETEFRLPFIDKASLFLYYRGAYDSIFNIAPGGLLRTQDGGRATRISDIRGSDRFAVGHENVLREAYLDVSKSIVSFRIGRQQIVWSNQLTPGVLDTENTVDASWHASQESGLLGRVGFSELRIPFWAVKTLVNFETVGPFSNVFLEAYDSPFQFSPTDVRQFPAPWSLPFLNSVRGGEIIDIGKLQGGPAGVVLVQPCFDLTDNKEANGSTHTPTSGPNDIFANSNATGLCNSIGLQRSKALQGIYDKGDPFDVNQFGARIGASTQFGMDFSLAYIYRRSSGSDIIDSLPVKVQGPLVNSAPQNFLEVRPHQTTDQVLKESHNTIGYLRLPLEFYYPYIHTMGGTVTYFDEFTEIVYNLETAYRMGVPIGTVDPTATGTKKKDTWAFSLLLDRQTWIRFLHPRSTFTTLFQTTAVWLRDHEGLETNSSGAATNGDVGVPNSTLIPHAFGTADRLDKIREFEWFSLFAITNFYRGGTIAPLLGIISDWGNAPSFEYLFLCDFYATNNLIFDFQGRIFTNFGRNVDEPFGIGRYSQNDEVGLKVTYQW